MNNYVLLLLADSFVVHPFEMSINCFLLVVGYDVYLVGGCVRDLVLKKTPKDFDIITSAELKEVTYFYFYNYS